MNYIEQIRGFWRSHEEHSFSTTEIAMYFHLLEVCNSCQWKNPFKRRNNKIEAELNISYNTLKHARNRLTQYNIISFKSQNGNSNVEYTLLNFDKVSIEVSIDVDSSSNFDEVTNEVGTRFLRGKHEVLSDININKTETKQYKEIKEESLTLNFPFSSVLFLEKWNLLVSTPKWKNKIPQSLQLSLDTLGKYEEAFSIEMINQAIVGEWGMFKRFELDEYYKKFKSPPEKPKKETSKNFKPPTIDEVKAYCKKRNNNVDAQKFVDFYQSKGWMVGKSKMKDWEACVRTWEKETSKNVDKKEVLTSSVDYGEKIRQAQELQREKVERETKKQKSLIDPEKIEKQIPDEELTAIKKRLSEL